MTAREKNRYSCTWDQVGKNVATVKASSPAVWRRHSGRYRRLRNAASSIMGGAASTGRGLLRGTLMQNALPYWSAIRTADELRRNEGKAVDHIRTAQKHEPDVVTVKHNRSACLEARRTLSPCV